MTAADHAWALTLFQRIVAGVAPTGDDVERAEDHIAGCALCGGMFEETRMAAFPLREEQRSDAARSIRHPEDMADARVDPLDLFERAYARGLFDEDATARRRSAEQLGLFDRVGLESLGRLARLAGTDSDRDVRAAALGALDRLDAAVSIPQRVIEIWSASPIDAAPFIADVLARLAADRPNVAELTGSAIRGDRGLAIVGQEGITGTLLEDPGGFVLELEGLPSRFERTRPVVAVPGALQEDPPTVRWSGERPGLVPASDPVSEGALSVRLGKGEAERERLFATMYLLDVASRAARD